MPLTLADLHRDIWGDLATGKQMDMYRRDLQKSYIGALSDILTALNAAVTESEEYSLARTDLQRVLHEMTIYLPKYTGVDRSHMESQIAVIRRVMSTRQE